MSNLQVIKFPSSIQNSIKKKYAKPEIVVSDFDGTIANSTASAISGIRKILSLIGQNEPVSSFSDYWRIFGKKSMLKNVSLEQRRVLREMHRMVMQSDAEKIELFNEVMTTYSQLKKKPLIVSSSYANTVTKALRSFSTHFEKIYGFEHGRKEEILQRLKKRYHFIYITDTRIDILRCRNIGVPVIGVSWGFDKKEILLNASPDFIANDFDDLKNILFSLNLLKIKSAGNTVNNATKKMNIKNANTIKNGIKTETDFLNNQNLNNMSNVTITADDQKIEKTGDNMNNLDTTLQKQPDKVGIRQAELDARLSRLTEMNNSIIGRWEMSRGSKELLRIDEKSNQEALQIIRTGENNNLSAIADYQTRYLKAILHNLVLIGESNMTGAAKLHFENAKMVLHDKLLRKMEEMTIILQDFEGRAMGRPEKYKKVLIDAADRTLIQWGDDFDTHLDEFSELLKKTFSR